MRRPLKGVVRSHPQTGEEVNPRTDSWLRTFLIIFTGQAFSLLGSAAVNFALVWWITAETGSATVLAYAGIAAILPQALLGPIAGPFVDRWDRRLTIMAADGFVAATSLVLVALFAAGKPQTGTIVAIIAARSLGAAFHTPASQAAVPMYVPAEQLMRVSGWNFFMGSGVAMAGPVLGALLIGSLSMPAVFAVDVMGAIVAIASLLLVRIPNPQHPDDELAAPNFVREFTEGWRELVQHRGLLDMTLVLTAVTLLYMPINALFPLMTRAHFHGGAGAASVAELAFGAGMLIGSLAIGTLSARFSGVRLVASGILVLGVALAVSGLLPSSAFWAFAVLCVAMGVSAPLFGAPLTAMFQTLIDPAKLGRVMSLYMTMSMLVAPAGLALAGPLAERTGVAPWFAISGALIAAAAVLLRSIPSVRGLDAAVAAAEGAAGPGSPATAEVELQAE
jgi:DHA3 family macrolide efflux protein-like MFS transporter